MRLPPALACLGLLLLAACSSGQQSRTSAAWPEIRAEFQPGPAAQVIELLVVDPVPLDGAELLLPDGRIVPSDPIASVLHGERAGGYGGGVGFGFGVFGGSSSGTSTGIGLSLPLFGYGPSAERPGSYESRTRFFVADMRSYRESWQYWKIRIRIGNPLQTTPRYHLLAAPPPPTAN